MALQKSIGTPYGVEASYWKILRLNGLFDGAGLLEVMVAGYIDSAARSAGAQPLAVVTKTFEGVDAGRADIYAMLKLEPEFYGALDV